MSTRIKIALLALLVFIPFAIPTPVLADAGQKPEISALVTIQPQASQACNPSLDKKLNLAQTIQTGCCKVQKGICGCRAGKIVCCDGTASSNCTCHGEDGFIQ